MNGRVYDPTLGRMLQADPFIQAPISTQSYNRYSYVMNNPLGFIDPSGYKWKTKDILTLTAVIAISVVTYNVVNVAIIGPMCVALGSATAIGAGIGAGASAGFASGVSMAAFSGASFGETLHAGGKGAISGAVFGGIAGHFGDSWNATRVGANSLAGGVTSEINGGEFKEGFQFALATSLIRVGWEHMRAETNRLKELSCGSKYCERDSDGELMTYGNRTTEQMPGIPEGKGNFITRSTMDPKLNEGVAFADNRDGFLAKAGNMVSKAHDYWNSNVSRVVGFHGYSETTGAVLTRGDAYNTAFNLWSISGFVPAAVYTGAAISAEHPYVYHYDKH
jgi:hypothetical protein